MSKVQDAPAGNRKLGSHRLRIAAALLALVLLCGFSGLALADSEEGSEEASVESVELPGARTATSNTYELPDGKRETVIYESPVNFKDAEGDWKPIRDGLEEQPDGSGLTNAANSFDLSLPDRIGDGAVRLDTGEAWVSQELLGLDTAPAEVEGSAASYTLGNEGVSF